MYKTKTNEELLKQYAPSNIGKRIFHRLEEMQLSMRDFESILIRLLPSQFSNMRKYIPYSEIKSTVQADRRKNSFFENLGGFALSYAITMYGIALVLKLDAYYLATGREQLGNCLLQSERGARNMNKHISAIQQMLMSSCCLDECGARLRICREKRKLTIKQLADLIRISPSTVCGYENSNSYNLPRYSYPILFKMSEVLGVSTDFIVLGSSIPNTIVNKPARQEDDVTNEPVKNSSVLVRVVCRNGLPDKVLIQKGCKNEVTVEVYNFDDNSDVSEKCEALLDEAEFEEANWNNKTFIERQ